MVSLLPNAENAHANHILRGAVAELIAADRLILTAADRVLAEAGLGGPVS